MVKEFETGSGITVTFVLQRQEGTEIGSVETTTFEHMCSHSLFLATNFIEKGATVLFPLQEPVENAVEHSEARIRSVRNILTEVLPNAKTSVAQDLLTVRQSSREGDTVLVFVAAQDPDLPDAIVGWNDAKVVCFCYDPKEFLERKMLPPGVKSAADPAYIDRLERAGAETIVLGRHEVIKS